MISSPSHCHVLIKLLKRCGETDKSLISLVCNEKVTAKMTVRDAPSLKVERNPSVIYTTYQLRVVFELQSILRPHEVRGRAHLGRSPIYQFRVAT